MAASVTTGELAVRVDGIQGDVKLLRHKDEFLEAGIDKIKNRPPVWCTLIIALLTAICGWLLRAATIIVSASGG